ncbi:LOW QUALITY PROTEIN: uncharacterized protein LOC112557626 [Pomacea canaliculata]|uniref:LOW QUALITY PROTEIN: uncharacterized protein LOC112557626 n=1 Tax=Pomacea canaliculata TaxID=400727 RepID=UPI000D737AB3|nr:LOW QUALITY PROTEIN: uncharacterized protein LOC112557626 [Pomacea canaliculata]
MLDESLDVAVQKKLVIFCRVIDEEVGQTEFAANIEVKDGKADTIMDTIMDFLHDVDVPLERVSGIGTDGAAVMVGRLNGVVVNSRSKNPKLVGTWCVAHRLALVCQWASKSVPYLETVQTTLANIFDFFHYSACRYNKLRELKGVDEKHRCSKVFQKDSIDIRQVEDMLAATSATLKDLAEHPGSVLQDFFTQVADSGHFQGITVTGSEDIRYEEIDGEAARDSFRLFKALLGKHREKGLQAMCQHMLLQCTETFPEFVTLAEISTTIRVTSAPCERGFSQNLIHTFLRSCLSIKAVENKMFIKNAAKHPKYSEHKLITDACTHFMEQKCRRF